MSRRLIKTVLLVLLVASIVGSGVAQKPARNTLIPMMALLSGESGFKITDDGIGPYFHEGIAPELNNVTIDTDGHFLMVVRDVSNRKLKLLFNTQCKLPTGPNPDDCPDPSFILSSTAVETTYWMLRTYWKCRYIPHEDPDGTKWTELIRSTTRKDSTILDLRTMAPGETIGVSVEGMRFCTAETALDCFLMTGQQLEGDPGSAAYLLVTATDWDGDGVMDWLLRTIPGKVVIRSYDRTDVLLDGECFKLTGPYPCRYGAFKLPFELKIAKVK